MKTKLIKLILRLSTKLTIWTIEKLTGQSLRPKNNTYCNGVSLFIHSDSVSVDYYWDNESLNFKFPYKK